MTLDNINWATVDRIIRVDHAGEYGANRIYAGQMAVLGRTSVGPVIQKMWDQEKDHLKKFSELMVQFRVRPTVLMPFWNVLGFALGAGTALLGKEGAMACTVAVEETIAHHYNNQIRTLMEEDPEKYEELLQIIKTFRDEELEHHDVGLDHDAQSVGYKLLERTQHSLPCPSQVQTPSSAPPSSAIQPPTRLSLQSSSKALSYTIPSAPCRPSREEGEAPPSPKVKGRDAKGVGIGAERSDPEKSQPLSTATSRPPPREATALAPARPAES
ncbi:NADPH-dependent 3-demethoxyubiquinone 3-hydroxylase, mitochondrial [Rhynchocyon petersi]